MIETEEHQPTQAVIHKMHYETSMVIFIRNIYWYQ